ncbi:MAG TPA: fused MFS/spermidine synthase [Vicinamibacterales bacterium]|nr:fused MFS/spermidine synthase [Vicinamibacterales bacterium]
MTRLFALAIFFSATLLFMVQPLVAKILLPVLGGSPAVWGTCLVFFQAVLLLGYLYAHALSTRVPRRRQWLVHLAVLIAAGVVLPMPMEIGEPGGADPRWWMLGRLARSVGLPFFALSATAPLLQHWFSQTQDPKAKTPYFLYAVSNAGSLLGLLGYLLIEPFATRSAQVRVWSAAFWGLGALIAACAYISGRRPQPRTRDGRAATQTPVALSRLVLWVALALVPSALLLGVTQHLATDVVSVPLLWVVPLALYLLTFIAAFSTNSRTSTGRFGSSRLWGAIAPLVALLVLVLSLGEVRYPILPITLAHLAAFTVLAMLCHTRLAESRPGPAHLTGYFVCVSLGGVLGGAAAALVAPIVFTSILEYPLAVALAILLRPQNIQADEMTKSTAGRWAWRAAAVALSLAGFWGLSAFDRSASTTQLSETMQHVVRASFAIPAALLLFTPRTALLFAGMVAGLLVAGGVIRTGGDVLHRERTFFGVHQVTSVQNGDYHELTHGTTTHGVQAFRGKGRLLPTAYYHPSGPIGDVVFTLAAAGRFHDVGVVGLGAGALAGYANNGIRMDFFEVDEAVIRIAENPSYFTYLTDARARPDTTVRTMAVDGRLGLRAMPAASYDLIVVDAFTSDAIPTHLITREAVAIYESRLKPHGVLAFHVSSRFFDLPPVLAKIAGDQQLVCFARDDREVPPERAAEAMRPSTWVVLARDDDDLFQLVRSAPRWVRLTSNPDEPLWTDDYTSVLSVLEK